MLALVITAKRRIDKQVLIPINEGRKVLELLLIGRGISGPKNSVAVTKQRDKPDRGPNKTELTMSPFRANLSVREFIVDNENGSFRNLIKNIRTIICLSPKIRLRYFCSKCVTSGIVRRRE